MTRLPVLLLLVSCLACPSAKAARSYDNCTGYVDSLPAVISTQGTWCLRQDLGTAITSGAAILIATNNVTLDCNDFKLGGLAAGIDTMTEGVHADLRFNATVRNCTIRGFYRGVNLGGEGAGHLVEDNRLEGNTYIGIAVRGSNSTIRNNLVIDSGGTVQGNSQAYGIHADGDAILVLDNSVTGVLATDGAASSVGIYGFGDVVIGRNRVAGLDETSTALVGGIYTFSGRPVIHDNVVLAPADNSSTVGVHCGGSAGTASRNILIGFELAVNGCLVSSNVVNSN